MIVIMVFTSLIFLFVFFPVLLISYYFALKLSNIKKLASLRLMDVVLSILSLAFFAWTGLNAACTFIYFILIIYLIGKALEKCKRKNVYWAKILVLVGVLLTLSGLYIFKYAGYISELVYENLGISIMGSPTWSFLGVSFVSFSAISYIIDIYRGNRCGNFLDVALYLSFFPKVISGPIVLWKDFQPQIKKHSPNLESFIRGINLLAVGCAKKVILADPFGALATEIQTQSVIGIDVPTAWGCAFVYTLQIYYDFSGYSDIARGISFMLGYDLKKNFDFPYVSQSISEFWRRWHISLGSWFREYIYIPWGGGNRKGTKKTLRNLFIVFLITGIWHGAGIGYLLWGITHGICVVIERCVRDKELYKRIPAVLKWAVTMFIVFSGWQVFRLPDTEQLLKFLSIMFGTVSFETITFTWKWYFTTRVVVMMLIGSLGATVLNFELFRNLYKKINTNALTFILQEIVILLLLILSVLYIVNSTYSPFIYFQY